MVKYTQIIRRQHPTNCMSVCDHFVGLAPKGLRSFSGSFLPTMDKSRCLVFKKQVVAVTKKFQAQSLLPHFKRNACYKSFFL